MKNLHDLIKPGGITLVKPKDKVPYLSINLPKSDKRKVFVFEMNEVLATMLGYNTSNIMPNKTKVVFFFDNDRTIYIAHETCAMFKFNPGSNSYESSAMDEEMLKTQPNLSKSFTFKDAKLHTKLMKKLVMEQKEDLYFVAYKLKGYPFAVATLKLSSLEEIKSLNTQNINYEVEEVEEVIEEVINL